MRNGFYRLFLTLTLVMATGIHSLSAQSANSLRSVSRDKHSGTEIRMLTPFTGEGLNPKLHIVKETTGVCWSSSLVNTSRPNTWRCHAEDKVYDPCFKSPIHNQNSVVCMQHPWDKKVVILKLKSPLPSTKASRFSSKKSQPWAIELGNGRMCTLITGPKAQIAGMKSRYSCSSGAVVVGDIDRSNPVWHVFYLGNEDLYMHQTPVISAWY